MKKNLAMSLWKGCGFVLCLLLLALNGSPAMQQLKNIPKTVYTSDAEALFSKLFPIFSVSGENDSLAVSSDGAEQLYQADTGTSYTIRLFDAIPVKTVTVRNREEITLIPGGESLGISIYTKGVLVVGLGEFTDDTGKSICPAKEGGIKTGDIILSADCKAISGTETLCEAVKNAGSSMELTVLRDGKTLLLTVKPAVSRANDERLLGLWVRESTAGIGTLSFFEPVSSRYGALGHPITDVDLGSIISVGSGSIVKSKILGVSAGEGGQPGEIHGIFSTQKLGGLDKNTVSGIFGEMYGTYESTLYPEGVLLGYPDEAELGDAEILTTIDGNGVQSFSCKIIQVNDQTQAASKGLVIEIMDERLLATTGGIVQGMSGSPLIQNGKLIGIVTHVFVNDPTKGYCIYALWMYNAM